jgi:hypothetical protein
MSEHIQKDGGEVAIVIYDAPFPPKYFRITKKFLNTLFVVIPIFFVVLLSGFFLWGLSDRLEDTPTPELPSVISNSSNKIDVLKKEIKMLKDSNKLLAFKISQVPTVLEANDPYLSVIKKPYGMQIFTAENRIKLEQFEFSQETDKVSLKFQIINSFSSKVTGYVTIFMISESGLNIYPKEANQTISEGVKFNSGEPFSVSRLRPTNAEFLNRPKSGDVRFVIYIFSRDGDLLLVKETEKYKIGTK